VASPAIGLEQYAETRVQLKGWKRDRRVIVTRILKPVNPTQQDVFWGVEQEEFIAAEQFGIGGKSFFAEP